VLPPHQQEKFVRGTKAKEHAMAEALANAIAFVGIDITLRGPSRRHVQHASAFLKIFVRHPKKTYATKSAMNGSRQF
jgi:hypothetical protein